MSEAATSRNGSVLATVSGDETDSDVVRLACELVRRNKGKLFILYVIEVQRTLPVDAEISMETSKAEDVLNSMEALAKGMRCRPQAELLQSRQTGAAVVQEAVEKDVGTIVMGTSYQQRYGLFSLGEAVPYVLEHSPRSVIVCRGSVQQNVSPDESLSDNAD